MDIIMTHNLKLKKRPLLRDIAFVCCLAAGLSLALILGSFKVDDATIFRYPQSGHVMNLGGIFGASMARVLIRFLGWSAWLLPCACVGLGWQVISSGTSRSWLVKFLSFPLLVASVSGLVAMISQRVSFLNQQSYAPAGFVGNCLSEILTGWLNPAGTFVLLFSLACISLMILTRFAPFLWLEKVLVLAPRGYVVLVGVFRAIIEKVSSKKVVQVTEQSPATLEVLRSPEENKMSMAPVEMVDSPTFFRPWLTLLDEPPVQSGQSDQAYLTNNARRVEEKLAEFGVRGEVVDIRPGPLVSMYEYQPAPGVKINRISGLADELAMTLMAHSVRIVAPIPGRGVVGIEIPNSNRELVCLREVLASSAFQQRKARLPVVMGKDLFGNPHVSDLSEMPHLLVAGTTGSGKSVFINSLLLSLLYSATPEEVRLLLVDPKRLELSVYADIPHLLHPVVTESGEAVKLLNWAVQEMERRYLLLAEKAVRDIEGYNRKLAEEKSEQAPLPRIVLVIDEFASLLRTAGREIEAPLVRLAQMARAAGIHLVLATQRPSVDVITGLIKANFSTRVAFQVSTNVDSRTILDQPGAEKLLGKGDMLFMSRESSALQRLHGAWVSDEEVERVVSFLRQQAAPRDQPSLVLPTNAEVQQQVADELDEKWDEALSIVVSTKQISISMLQRRLRIGYNRSARIIELMEQKGYIAPSDGTSRPRDVLIDVIPE